MVSAEPLSKFPVLQTERVGQAEAAIARSLADSRIAKVSRSGRFRLKMNAVGLGQTSLVFNHYAAGATVETVPSDEFHYLSLGVGSPTTFVLRGNATLASGEQWAVQRSGDWTTIERPADSGLLVVRAPKDALLRHWEAATGESRPRQLELPDTVSATEGAGGRLRRTVSFVAHELQSAGTDPALRASLDQLLLSALLPLVVGGSAGTAWTGRVGVDKRPARRAEEYLRTQFHEAITIADLVRESGCSRSVLFEAFKQACGCTPMEYLTELRLSRAMARLRSAGPDDTVTEIALACGFTHLGRFSELYRNRFDELPSATLRR
jgi:AraC-like DNA-binding protein